MDADCQRTKAPNTAKKSTAGRGSDGGQTIQPVAATSTAALPIQNNRDWLEPLLKKRAAMTRAAAGSAAPRTAGTRIAGEASTGNRGKFSAAVEGFPANKAFT